MLNSIHEKPEIPKRFTKKKLEKYLNENIKPKMIETGIDNLDVLKKNYYEKLVDIEDDKERELILDFVYAIDEIKYRNNKYKTEKRFLENQINNYKNFSDDFSKIYYKYQLLDDYISDFYNKIVHRVVCDRINECKKQLRRNEKKKIVI